MLMIQLKLFSLKSVITAYYELEPDVIKINHFSNKEKLHDIHCVGRSMAKDSKIMDFRRNN